MKGVLLNPEYICPKNGSISESIFSKLQAPFCPWIILTMKSIVEGLDLGLKKSNLYFFKYFLRNSSQSLDVLRRIIQNFQKTILVCFKNSRDFFEILNTYQKFSVHFRKFLFVFCEFIVLLGSLQRIQEIFGALHKF